MEEKREKARAGELVISPDSVEAALRKAEEDGPPNGDHIGNLERKRMKRNRAEMALELRSRGYSYEQIGRAIGVKTANAYQICARHMRRTVSPQECMAMKATSADRLDMALRHIVPILEGIREVPTVDADGNETVRIERYSSQEQLAAARTLVDIEERRAKLFGLDGQLPAELPWTGPEYGSKERAAFKPFLKGATDEELRTVAEVMRKAKERLESTAETPPDYRPDPLNPYDPSEYDDGSQITLDDEADEGE
jgi:hypothetical protein